MLACQRPSAATSMLSGSPSTGRAWSCSSRCRRAVLGSHPVGAPERGGMGFTLLLFAGELASVLAFGELGSASVDAPLRRACLESIAAASLNAAGCLVGGEWVRPPGRR